VTALADPLGDLREWLPRAAALITEPDTDGTAGHGKPGSRPPWNSQAANAYYDAAPFLRGLEASMRLAVTGTPGQARGGSDGNTRAALDAISRFAWTLTRVHDGWPREYNDQGRPKPCRCPYCRADREVTRMVRVIQQHPAIDEAETPQRVPFPCPYCEIPMMRLFPRAGLVVCLRGGFACLDGDGNPPKGHARQGRLGAVIEWEDGLVT
jgi:hypothetical protein